MNVEFEVVELYFNDPYIGWQAKKPKDRSNIYEEAYFIKISGQYFMLGRNEDSYYVTESK